MSTPQWARPARRRPAKNDGENGFLTGEAPRMGMLGIANSSTGQKDWHNILGGVESLGVRPNRLAFRLLMKTSMSRCLAMSQQLGYPKTLVFGRTIKTNTIGLRYAGAQFLGVPTYHFFWSTNHDDNHFKSNKLHLISNHRNQKRDFEKISKF